MQCIFTPHPAHACSLHAPRDKQHMLQGAWGATDACTEADVMRVGSLHKAADTRPVDRAPVHTDAHQADAPQQEGGAEGARGGPSGSAAAHGPEYLSHGSESEVLVEWLAVRGPVQVRHSTPLCGCICISYWDLRS